MANISILLGSISDWPVLEKAVKFLKQFEVTFEVNVLSAHRTPKQLEEHLEKSAANVFIAAAGGAAHLAGAVAARTLVPVIGVPISNSLNGLDSLLSTVQMPAGIPVATVGVDNGVNAAVLALQILAVSDEKLRGQLVKYREQLAKKVKRDNEELGFCNISC